MTNHPSDIFTTTLPATAPEAFAYHSRPGALERLLPPWQGVRMLRNDASLAPGSEVHMRVTLGPFAPPPTWIARHTALDAPRAFVDEAVAGPMALWRHEHVFAPAEPGGDDADGACELQDRVRWALPLDALTRPLLGAWVRRELARMFAFRHRRTAEDLRRQRAIAAGGPRRVGLTGASGAIGRQLAAYLRTAGHEVVAFGRNAGEAAFDALAGTIDAAAIEGLDALIHLAGAPISQRWTPAARAQIADSRARGTAAVAEAVAAARAGPRVLVSASAIGLYGDRAEPVDEDSARGAGFAADVCAAWEAAADSARAAGVRVVHPRIGVVLDPGKGALAQLLPAFSACLGGRVGSGAQAMSWITMDDAVYALADLALRLDLDGPVNLVAPDARPQREFARALGDVLGRPALLPLPAFAVRAIFGAMGEELLLGGAAVVPRRLQDAGFSFAFPRLEDGLAHLLGRNVDRRCG